MLAPNRSYIIFGAILLAIWFVYLGGGDTPLHLFGDSHSQEEEEEGEIATSVLPPLSQASGNKYVNTKPAVQVNPPPLEEDAYIGVAYDLPDDAVSKPDPEVPVESAKEEKAKEPIVEEVVDSVDNSVHIEDDEDVAITSTIIGDWSEGASTTAQDILAESTPATIIWTGLANLSASQTTTITPAVQSTDSIPIDMEDYVLDDETHLPSQIPNGTDPYLWLTPQEMSLEMPEEESDPTHIDTSVIHGFTTLQTLCARTNWIDGLWLQCHSWSGSNRDAVAGGLNNARNRIQTCVRLAIDAGAGLIIPPIATQRGSGAPSQFSSEAICADEYFNIDFLSSRLASECPQLRLRMCGDSHGTTKIETPVRHYSEAPHSFGTFDKFIKAIMRGNNISIDRISPEHAVAVHYGDSFIAWNYTSSLELASIRRDLFKLLTFPSSLLHLSSTILNSPILSSGFIAVHLRGESDWPGEFGNVDQQISLFVSEIILIQSLSSISIVYVSSGSVPAISWLASHLEPLGFTVVSKWTILSTLSPDLLTTISSMEFDKQAIVEYNVLVAADYWMGVMMSTMSLLVAYARNVDAVAAADGEGEGEGEDFFEKWIVEGSVRVGEDGKHRVWEGELPVLKGNAGTKLLVVNPGPRGLAIFDSFP